MVVMEESVELKVGLLQKRAQNKSFFFKRDNYQSRVFVLDSLTLRYFAGSQQNRGERKGRIDLVSVLAVEVVQDKLLDGKHNVFQVVYNHRDESITLYVICPSANARDSWISAIRHEADKNCAQLQGRYHKGIWRKKGGYNCCGNKDKHAPGCAENTPISYDHGRNSPTNLSLASFASGNVRLSTLLVETMLKRSIGKSAFFPRENYKSRTFVLDANSVRYYDGDTRIRKNEKGRIHLSCVVTVEPVEVDDEAQHTNMFQISYFDDFELHRLYIVANDTASRDKWVKAVKKEAIKTGAEFLPTYHSGYWVKHKGKWACCSDQNKQSDGCRRVIVQPEMKLCGTDLNSSVTASALRAKSPPELKVACMLKRSQNKSTFFISTNYQERVFTLDHQCFAFYTGYLEDRGQLKGYIHLADIVTVEPVTDGMLEDKVNVFQILYYEDTDLFNLYIVANSDKERQSWIAAIKKEALKANVVLHPRYHPGVWLKSNRKYNCCGRVPRDSPGCSDVSGMSLVSMRDRLNTMESMKGMRHRLGTLDSVPEEVGLKSSRLEPSSAALRPRSTWNSNPQPVSDLAKEPSNVSTITVEKKTETNDENKENKKAPVVSRESTIPSREPTIHRSQTTTSQWSRGMSDMNSSAVGPRSVSGHQNNRSKSVYSGGTRSSQASSRQHSFLTTTHYSEDFESVSEIEV